MQKHKCLCTIAQAEVVFNPGRVFTQPTVSSAHAHAFRLRHGGGRNLIYSLLAVNEQGLAAVLKFMFVQPGTEAQ